MGRSRAVAIASLACALVVLDWESSWALPQEAAPAEGQVLHIFVGKAVVINVQARLTRVLASNPGVIETVATTPTQVVVEGKTPGASSLILWDETGHSQMLDVVVDLDIAGLRTAIEQAYPGEKIEVQADGGRVLLSGSVSDTRISDELMKMVGFYSKEIVNSLAVTPTHERQILLEVKFAEVDRTRIQQLGMNIVSVGALNTIGAVSTQQYSPPAGSTSTAAGGAPISGTVSVAGAPATLSLPNLLNIFLFRPDLNLAAAIEALEQKAVLQILAQPNLLASNGQKASFLAGGEFPFPVVQGGLNVGIVTIQFRPFGVKLDFTGFITKDNVLRLHVAPEVSTLDYTNAISISGFVVPAISTRRAETEVELKDGQSFGIAGLLDRRAQATLSKIPGLGDIPVLGQLFRSKNINRSNTELMVLVTPHIVDPTHAPAPQVPKLAMPLLDSSKFDEGLTGSRNPSTPSQPPKPR
jgi:pilus assembly protein CpaC